MPKITLPPPTKAPKTKAEALNRLAAILPGGKYRKSIFSGLTFLATFLGGSLFGVPLTPETLGVAASAIGAAVAYFVPNDEK